MMGHRAKISFVEQSALSPLARHRYKWTAGRTHAVKRDFSRRQRRQQRQGTEDQALRQYEYEPE